MFRSRFSDVFPRSLLHLGPQDIENGVEGPVASDQVEKLLCSVLGLVLNRKKDIEYVACPECHITSNGIMKASRILAHRTDRLSRKGHYTRALEDAISQHQNQWPVAWQGKNPLSGSRTFNGMTAEEKVEHPYAGIHINADGCGSSSSLRLWYYGRSIPPTLSRP